MMGEPPQDPRPPDAELERWAEVARGRAPPPSGSHPWSELFEPLEPATTERIVDAALARARAAEPTPSRRRSSIGWAIAATLAMAAGLVLMLRTPGPSLAPSRGFDIEMQGRAELRAASPDEGGADPHAAIELRLRNETGWIVRAAHAAPRLYLVAHEPGRAPRRLEAHIDAQHGAFRVRGEVGALGLVPGEVTLWFVLGPDHAEAEALRVAQAAIDGEAPPSGWSLDARRLRILE